jgi:ATP/maltotriose-dependent transcriptional regulator MalT
MGQVLSMEGCHAEASEALEEAVALFVSMGAQRHEGVARGSLAQVFISLGLQEAAQRELRLACNLLKGNHRVGFCVYRANLAALMSIHGDVAEASQMAESALVEIRELNSKDNFCHVLANVAQVRFQQGDEAGSRQALDEAARMFSELKMAENSPVGQSISAAREATGYHG